MSNSIYDVSWMLGNYLDGWAELIEGKGNDSTKVRMGVRRQLKQREMPNVEVGEVNIKEGFLSGETRPYMETKTAPGVRTIIYIEKHGPDLYASWRSYMRPTINWELISVYLTIALVISTLLNGLAYLINVIQGISDIFGNLSTREYLTAIITFFIVFALVYISGYALLAIVGKVIRQDYSFYLNDNGAFTTFSIIIIFISALFGGALYNNSGNIIASETGKFFSNISQLFNYFGFPFWAIVSYAISLFLGILVLAAIFGLFFRRNLLAFITKEPSVFDVDDILAMNLSVHKTILRVLDEVGIETPKLRLKGQFKGGRSGETV